MPDIENLCWCAQVSRVSSVGVRISVHRICVGLQRNWQWSGTGFESCKPTIEASYALMPCFSISMLSMGRHQGYWPWSTELFQSFRIENADVPGYETLSAQLAQADAASGERRNGSSQAALVTKKQPPCKPPSVSIQATGP